MAERSIPSPVLGGHVDVFTPLGIFDNKKKLRIKVSLSYLFIYCILFEPHFVKQCFLFFFEEKNTRVLLWIKKNIQKYYQEEEKKIDKKNGKSNS